MTLKTAQYGLVLLCIIFNSCTAPKFVFDHEGVSYVDFTHGKWILNKPVHINTKYDFYDHSLTKWREVIKDSLYSLHDVRHNKLIAEKIDFEPSTSDIKNIRLGTDCDYLITTKAEVISEDLGSFGVSEPNYGTTYGLNEAVVEIKIYDLKQGKLIAARKAIGTIKDQATAGKGSSLGLALPSDGIVTNGIDRIVDYFKKQKNF